MRSIDIRLAPVIAVIHTQLISGVDRYFDAIQALQTRVIESQRDRLITIAGLMADTIAGDRRIFVFGTGHSHLLAEEGHFRAGGLAAVVPIFSTALMLHESASHSATLEHTGGMARPLLHKYLPEPGEMIFIFSNSGVNHVPVEMAVAAKEHGLISVAVCSINYARTAPLSPLGQRLIDLADYTIDNGGEPGDSLIPIGDLPWRVGPSSTVMGALIWNCLITEAASQLQRHFVDVPVYASANMPGASEHNATLLQKWQARNPHL